MKSDHYFFRCLFKSQFYIAFLLITAPACEEQQAAIGIGYSNQSLSQNGLSQSNSCAEYDLLLRVKTEDDHESADSPGPFRFTFKHRDTLGLSTIEAASFYKDDGDSSLGNDDCEQYASQGLESGQWGRLYINLDEGILFEDFKWIKVENLSGNGWLLDELVLYGPDGHCYYEMDENDDGHNVEVWIDGQSGDAPHYNRTLIQLFPQEPIAAYEEEEKKIHLDLSFSSGVSGNPFFDVTFYKNNTSVAEEFLNIEFQVDANTDTELRAELTLQSRLGEYRHVVIEGLNGWTAPLEDIRIYSQAASGDYTKYFEYDVTDGVDLDVALGDLIPLIGASTEHHWVGNLQGQNIHISNFFQGPEKLAGAGAAEGSFIATVQEALPQADNLVEVAIYKSQNETAEKLVSVLDELAFDDEVPVRYLVQNKDPELFDDNAEQCGVYGGGTNITQYVTGGSIFVDDIEDEKMHNKIVLVKNTNAGPAVLYGSCNLGSSSSGRYQAMTRISGSELFWRSYHRYYANLLKYAPHILASDVEECEPNGDLNRDNGVNVLDVVQQVQCILGNACPAPENVCAGDMNSDNALDVLDVVSLVRCIVGDAQCVSIRDFILGQPNNIAEGEYCEVGCASGVCASFSCNDSICTDEYHEFGNEYDVASIEYGNHLTLNAYFFPRVSGDDSPLKGRLEEVSAWLSQNENYRAEVYFMHMLQNDRYMMPPLQDLHDNPRADVLALGSIWDLNYDASVDAKDMNEIYANLEDPEDLSYQDCKNRMLGLAHSRYSREHHDVHSKWVAIRKWELEQGEVQNVEFVFINGSMNVTSVSVHGRNDENMSEIIWSADNSALTADFERRVYRAFTDHFKRAYNNTEHTEAVGESICDCDSDPLADDCDDFCYCLPMLSGEP